MSIVNPKELAKLAQVVEIMDPIDWGMLAVKEEEVYLSMAEEVIDIMKSYNPNDRQHIAMATIVKLLVENFMLNLKIQKFGE